MDVRFFATSSGAEPVRDWLREECSKEDRKLVGGRIARVLFCFDAKHILLLHAFIKKTPKTPAADLAVARGRMRQAKE